MLMQTLRQDTTNACILPNALSSSTLPQTMHNFTFQAKLFVPSSNNPYKMLLPFLSYFKYVAKQFHWSRLVMDRINWTAYTQVIAHFGSQ
jgi:hypothetical protein